MTRHIYEIRVIGSFGPATSEAFADMAVQVEPSVTVLSADLDQPELHAVLDRVRALGLELIEIKQAAPNDGLAGRASHPPRVMRRSGVGVFNLPTPTRPAP